MPVKVIIELEVAGSLEDVDDVVDRVLDAGTLQNAIVEYAEDVGKEVTEVTSCVVTSCEELDVEPDPGVFVHCKDETTRCEECAKKEGLDLGDDNVEVWEVGSVGWTAPLPPCKSCGKITEIVVNACDVFDEGDAAEMKRTGYIDQDTHDLEIDHLVLVRQPEQDSEATFAWKDETTGKRVRGYRRQPAIDMMEQREEAARLAARQVTR